MRQPFGRAHHVGALHRRQRAFDAAEDDVAAHPGGEVQDHVGGAVADAFGDLAVVPGIARGPAGLRVADMAVDDGRTRLRRVDGGIRDLFR